MKTAKHDHLHHGLHHPITLDDIRRIVAEHDALPEDHRVFDDPPKIKIPQHCIECGQDTESVVFGWDLLREAATQSDSLPIRIGMVCDRCQQEGS